MFTKITPLIPHLLGFIKFIAPISEHYEKEIKSNSDKYFIVWLIFFGLLLCTIVILCGIYPFETSWLNVKWYMSMLLAGSLCCAVVIFPLYYTRHIAILTENEKLYIHYDADPFVPCAWEVTKHLRELQFQWWDVNKLTLHQETEQQHGSSIPFNDLEKRLEDQPVLNANVLDYLLKHTELIPEDWKDKVVYFWGTIYYNSVDRWCVRGLKWKDAGWYWSYEYTLTSVWRKNQFFALFCE